MAKVKSRRLVENDQVGATRSSIIVKGKRALSPNLDSFISRSGNLVVPAFPIEQFGRPIIDVVKDQIKPNFCIELEFETEEPKNG